MKSFFQLFILGVIASFLSCDSEIEEQKPQLQKVKKEYLYGKWVSESLNISFDDMGQGKTDNFTFKWYLYENNELVLACNNSFLSYIITELTSTTLKMHQSDNEDVAYSLTKYLEVKKLYGMWQLDKLIYCYNKNGEGYIVNVEELENVQSIESINNKKTFLWNIDGYNLQLFTEEDGVKHYQIGELTDSTFVYSSDESNKSYRLVRYVFYPKPKFDITDLYGKWVSGTVYYVYNSDGTGVTWDENDGMSEADGQLFTWEVDESKMVRVYKSEMGVDVHKNYIITELTPSTLKYYSAYNAYTYSFTKVN